MNKVYPEQLRVDVALAVEGRIRLLELEQLPFSSCLNCAGIGFMYAFYVEAGPFKELPQTKKPVRYIEEDEGWYIGRIRQFPCPVCSEGKMDLYLAEISGMEGDELNIRLDNFCEYKGKEEARKVAGELLSMTPSPIGFVTFHGDFGVGKTLVLKALVNGFRVAGVPAAYRRMSDLLANVRSGFADKAVGAADAILADYKGFRVLAIDEVDRINMTDWAMETTFRLLDGRYEMRGIMLTVLASNLSPEEMPRELQYLASRINGGIVVEIGGEDVRLAQGVTARQKVMEV